MKIKIYIAVGTLSVCLILGVWAIAQPETLTDTLKERQRNTLKGLQGVYVIVESLKPEVEKYGLTEQQLQTDVELRLRQNGIKVLSQQEWLSTPGRPWLYVNVNVVIHDEPPLVVAYNILLKLKQDVLLERDTTKRCDASTWYTGSIGCASLGKIGTIREHVKNYVDKFINDYLAANPKK